MRTATITRKTAETEISVTIGLDGTGHYENHTGVGFFDHMLDQLSRHSLIDMTVSAKGDADLDMIAGGGSYGGTAGVGVSNTTLVKTDVVEAFIAGGSDIKSGGTTGLKVLATSTEDINTIAVGGAGGGESAKCAYSHYVAIPANGSCRIAYGGIRYSQHGDFTSSASAGYVV